jgi:hypothetical protein
VKVLIPFTAQYVRARETKRYNVNAFTSDKTLSGCKNGMKMVIKMTHSVSANSLSNTMFKAQSNSPHISEITPVDVARFVGLDPNTTRRYLRDGNPVQWERTRKKWPASDMPRLAQICESKRQRRCLNKFNAQLRVS